MQLVIRPFRPSDKDAVCTLYTAGVKEHISPCFHNAMTSPFHSAFTLALFAVGYLLGSNIGVLVLPGVWVGLVYFCCHELYAGLAREKLHTDMQDIPGNYQSRPDDCFLVAEAKVDERPEIVGMVAVLAKQSGNEKHGELLRMFISKSCRRMGLGVRMAQTVIDFCKERGFSKVELVTSSPLTPAISLYKKLGFNVVLSHTKTQAPSWIVALSKVTILRMEKQLSS